MKAQSVPQSEHEVDKHEDSHPDEHHDDHHFKEYSAKELSAIKIRGALCVLGGICIHFVLGTFYLWGGISPYIAAYMKSKDESVTTSTMQIVFPILGIATDSVLSFGVKLAAKIGFKVCIGAGGCIISLAFLILSFFNNMIGFIIVYCFMVGIASGMIYMLPISIISYQLVCGWKFFPGRRGMVSGLIIAGYGFGAFTFNFICKAICNPNNKETTIVYIENGLTVKYFDSSVYDNVPTMFRIMALCYFILTIIGTLLVIYPKDLNLEYLAVLESQPRPSGVNHETAIAYHPTVLHSECETFNEGIVSRPFLFLMPMILTSILFGMLMANMYKTYGLHLGFTDEQMTLVGSLHSASNGCSRALWAMLMDKIGFKKVFLLITAINIVTSGVIGYIGGSMGGYLVVLCIVMACEGGLLSCFPAITAKIFGQKVGPIIYGVLFFLVGISNMIGYLLYKFVTPELQYTGVFWIVFGICIASFILGLFFREQHDWKKKQ